MKLNIKKCKIGGIYYDIKYCDDLRDEKNLQLDFSGKDFFAFTIINEEWVKELERLNPSKKIEIKTLPKLTKKYYKELYN